MINGQTFRDAIISGANNISNLRQRVDELNVFPVPDGDTGTNMYMTITNAKKELEKLPDDASVGEVAQVASSALLRGARGNSGVILSLLFRGFSKSFAKKDVADATDLANALTLGVENAYKAVMKPTEGTILTVARVAAEKAKDRTDITDTNEMISSTKPLVRPLTRPPKCSPFSRRRVLLMRADAVFALSSRV